MSQKVVFFFLLKNLSAFWFYYIYFDFIQLRLISNNQTFLTPSYLNGKNCIFIFQHASGSHPNGQAWLGGPVCGQRRLQEEGLGLDSNLPARGTRCRRCRQAQAWTEAWPLEAPPPEGSAGVVLLHQAPPCWSQAINGLLPLELPGGSHSSFPSTHRGPVCF